MNCNKTQLQLYLNRLYVVGAGQLASEEWWGRQGTHVPAMPPSSVLQDVLRDLFQAPALPSSFTRTYLSAGTPATDSCKTLALMAAWLQ